MNRFLGELAQACKQWLLEEKWLLAPSLRVANQWIDAVARGGVGVVNARPKTIKGLVLDLAAPEIAQRQATILSGRGGEMLVDRMLHEFCATKLEYLSALQPSVGLAQTVYRSINAMRLSGLTPDRLQTDRFETAEKGRDIVKLFREYERLLAESGYVDYAEALRLARRRLQNDRNAIADDVLLLLPADLDFEPLELALLDAIPQSRQKILAVDEPVGFDEAVSFNEAEELPTSVSTDVELLRWLGRPSEAPAPVRDGSVKIVRAVGEVNELRQALRHCLANQIPLDTVELLHTDADKYVSALVESLGVLPLDNDSPQADWPVTFAEGIPCRYSRPGRALVAWLHWVANDFPQSTLVSMIRDGVLETKAVTESELSYSALGSLLAGLSIGFGRGRYVPEIDRQISAITRKLTASATNGDEELTLEGRESFTRRVEELNALRDLVVRLLETSPDRRAPLAAILESARVFLLTLARTADKIDNYARERLVIDIEDMGKWLSDDQEQSLDAWEWLAALPSEATILGSSPRPGCLHVANVQSGGHSGRPNTILIGLDDGRFPGGGMQDPLLLDNERRQISASLPTAAGRLQKKALHVARLLARLRGRVVLSYCCHDLIDDRELFPSPALLAVFRLVSGQREADQGDLIRWLGPAASFAPTSADECLSEADWWLWRLCCPQTLEDPVALLDRNYPHLARGYRATQERQSDLFTPYDGYVAAAGRDLDPTAIEGPVLSASGLETLGRCPLAYFFHYGLGVSAKQEIAIDPNRWLDHLASGSLLHTVFERFGRELIAQSRAPRYPDDEPRLRAILDEEVDAHKRSHPPPSEPVFRREYTIFQLAARVFLMEDSRFCEANDCRPVFVEATLGMKPTEQGTPLDSAAPGVVTLPNGKKIRTRGRVDRIDQVGSPADAKYAIWDYKTGSAYKFKRADPFQQGRYLQPFVYLSMVENRLREAGSANARIESFGYFFPGSRDRGERISWTAERLAEGAETLQSLCDLVVSGAFLPTDNDKSDCCYCDYKSVCGDVETVARTSKAKLENSMNRLLQPFRTLRANGKTQDQQED